MGNALSTRIPTLVPTVSFKGTSGSSTVPSNMASSSWNIILHRLWLVSSIISWVWSLNVQSISILKYWLSQVWWVKCILRYIPPSEGVELTTKTQRTQRSIDPM
uniref:Similarity n=1 Tax=Microcystis aeruginosa (strain PCC 7806) TaxID=267872 RepID=A8YAG1_MICA7|nr:unnamed protein product [Microcystis aeruginosa PCC 7806]